MNRKSSLIAIAALAAALTAAGCGSSSSSTTASTSTTTSAAAVAKTVGVTQGLAVSSPASGALQYVPSALAAKAGKVTITFTNPSPVPHNLAIFDSQGHEVGTEMEPFANGTHKTTATVQPGTYTFMCQVPGHSAAGMKGKLVVS
ncbi:MAG: plastocyanin/azurin family copper-binding protein [Actinomycetes bacterium]